MTGNAGMTTLFDDVVDPLLLPAELLGGDVAEAMVMDGIVRGHGIVGRCIASEAMIGLKVDSGGHDVHVELTLSTDDSTHAWWAKRVGEIDTEVDPRQPRILTVSSQREVKGAVVLSRRPEDGAGPTRAVLEFVVPARSIDPHSLLMIDIAGHEPVAEGRTVTPTTPRPLIGVRIDSVSVERLDPTASIPTQVSSGEVRRSALRGGYVAVVPGSDSRLLELALIDDVTVPGAALLVDRAGRYGRGAVRVLRRAGTESRKAARRALRSVHVVAREGIASRALSDQRLAVLATDLDGRPVELEVFAKPVSGPAGSLLCLRLPEWMDRPVLVHVGLDAASLRAGGFSPHSEWSIVGVS